MDNCQAGPCPNGHMGTIIDGTYTALDKLYAFFKSAEGAVVIPSIEAVARSVSKHKTTAEDGLEEIADLLPTPELKASVKQLGVKSALGGILIVLCVLGSSVKIGSDASTIYKNLSPSLPAAPTIIIHNNPTNINTATAGHSSSKPVSHRPNRHERLKAKSLEAKANKRAGGSKAKAKDECEPRIDPSDPHGHHS